MMGYVYDSNFLCKNNFANSGRYYHYLREIKLKDSLYVPGSKKNLISNFSFLKLKYYSIFFHKQIVIQKNNNLFICSR